MASSSITSAQVGTAVVSGAGALKGMAVTMPIAANADYATLLALSDGATGATLYAARLSDITAFMYGTKPNSVPATPAMPAAPPLGTAFAGGSIPFAQGLYVKSCPANVTFTATT